LGDLVMLRAYRMHVPVGHAFVDPRPAGISELLYQVQEFHGFLWASGGCYSDFYIHNIDECCWMKNAWPVEAKASGGRHYRGDYIDQNFDVYSTEYTFADGCKLLMDGRTMAGCFDDFASYVHGSKGSAIISEAGHWPSPVKIFRGQKMTKDQVVWAYPGEEANPYQHEWDHLIEAIVKDKPHNEVKRGAEASLVTSMGRMAAHTGQVVTFEEMLNCEHEFAPHVDQLKLDGPAPLLADARGKYPVPQPGLVTTREY
jgi:predicted dehydrogenase